MDVHFAPADLTTLDQLKTEALCLPVLSDERPLRGAPGLVDFRLCGRISELLVLGHLTGRVHEAVLIPARPRLMAERLLFLGAGPRDALDTPRLRAVLADTLARLVALKVRSAALVLPGRPQNHTDPAEGMEVLLAESAPHRDHLDELTVIDSVEAQREMRPLVDRARRRALADL